MMVKSLFITLSLLSLAACSSSGSGKKNTGTSTPTSVSSAASSSVAAVGSFKITEKDLPNLRKLFNSNADIALAVYTDAVTTAQQLQTALVTFKATPTQLNLEAAKKAWLVAREPYGQSEVYRFRLSPVDSSNYQDEDGPESHINSWPLGESLIDYVKTGTDFGDDQLGVTSQATGVNYPTQNIINSNIELNADLLTKTGTSDDGRDVITGYHAIEFMLWGQDLNLDASADTLKTRELSTGGNLLNSGGHRPLSDFTSDIYAARRHQYLELLAQKLVSDLTTVQNGWKVDANYRKKFTTATSVAQAETKLTEILTGMGTLSEGELAGERLQIAFTSSSQEEEHSCFSDNTHRDVWLDAEGISNSYYGEYAGYDGNLDGVDEVTTHKVDGYGLDDYLKEVSANHFAAELESAFKATKAAYEKIDFDARAGTPFDVMIMNRTKENPIYQTIIALNKQSQTIAKVAEALGLDPTKIVDDSASECDTTKPDQNCGG